MNTMGIGVGDPDRDGDFDLALTNITANKLMRNDGGTFTEDTQAGIGRPTQEGTYSSVTWGAVFGDYEPRRLGGPLPLGRQPPAGRPAYPSACNPTRCSSTTAPAQHFLDVSAATGADDRGESKGVAVADYDGDGDLDVFVVNQAGTPHLFENVTPRGRPTLAHRRTRGHDLGPRRMRRRGAAVHRRRRHDPHRDRAAPAPVVRGATTRSTSACRRPTRARPCGSRGRRAWCQDLDVGALDQHLARRGADHVIHNDELAPSPVAPLPVAGEPSPADRPVVLVAARDLQALRAGEGQPGHHHRVPVGRDPRPARRERLRQVDPARHRQRHQSGRTRARSRSPASCSTSASPKRAMELGLGMAYQTMTEVVGLTVAENLYLAAPPQSSPELRADGAVGGGAAARLRARHRRATRPPSPVDDPAPDARGGAGPALRSRRCCCSTSPRRHSATTTSQRLHRLIRKLAGRGIGIVYVSHRLPEVLQRGRPHHGPARRRQPGHVRRRHHVRGRRGRDDDRSPARARLPAATARADRRRGGARGRPAARPAVRSGRPHV